VTALIDITTGSGVAPFDCRYGGVVIAYTIDKL
jgi:hypothetical protein